MSEKKSIGNVNILDLRKATEASVAQIEKIGNVNVVLYTAETSDLVARINIGNLNAPLEVPDGQVQIILSKTVLNKDYFQNKTDPEFLAVIGKLQVSADVSVEDINTKIIGLAVIGKVLCPDHLLGALQAKSKITMGKFASYPTLKQVRFGDLTLDECSLTALEDHSELAVIGSLTIPAILPNELLERKLACLFAQDGVTCHEENAAQLQKCLHKDTPALNTIPAGHEWTDQPIVLDSLTLSMKAGRKLFCTQKVQIDPEVTPQQLEAGFASLVCKDGIYCPVELKASLAKICDLLTTRAVFYSGTLWVVEGEERLYNSFLEALDGKVTIVVNGMLTLDPGIQAKALLERLAKLHNHGAVFCPSELIGIVQLRLGIKEGVLQDSAQAAPADEPSEYSTGNANYLVL